MPVERLQISDLNIFNFVRIVGSRQFAPDIREYRLRSLGRWIATYGAAGEQRGGNGEAPQRAAEGEA